MYIIWKKSLKKSVSNEFQLINLWVSVSSSTVSGDDYLSSMCCPEPNHHLDDVIRCRWSSFITPCKINQVLQSARWADSIFSVLFSECNNIIIFLTDFAEKLHSFRCNIRSCKMWERVVINTNRATSASTLMQLFDWLKVNARQNVDFKEFQIWLEINCFFFSQSISENTWTFMIIKGIHNDFNKVLKLLCENILIACRSHGVMAVVCWIYTTAITPRKMTSRWLSRYYPVSRGTNQPIRKLECVQCMKIE